MDYPYDDRIGLIIKSYMSVAKCIAVVRKYNPLAIGEIRRLIETEDYVYSCRYVDDATILRLLRNCLDELSENGATVEIREHGRVTTRDFISNLIESYYAIEEETRRTVEEEEFYESNFDGLISLMPFREIRCGEQSIFDHVDESFVVPPKVIAYLQTTKPLAVCFGVYKHPFKGTNLLGPYLYTDGEYYWDRDAWKYVVKYHVTLPQAFIDKVMSDVGTAFLKECENSGESWETIIAEWKKQPDSICLLPDDAGDYSLDDF